MLRVHNKFGGMRDLAIFCGDRYSGCELKKGAGSRNFDNEGEQDFLFLLGWDAGIMREKEQNMGIKFCSDHILTLLCTLPLY